MCEDFVDLLLLVQNFSDFSVDFGLIFFKFPFQHRFNTVSTPFQHTTKALFKHRINTSLGQVLKRCYCVNTTYPVSPVKRRRCLWVLFGPSLPPPMQVPTNRRVT